MSSPPATPAKPRKLHWSQKEARRKEAIARIVRAWKVKIRRAVEPGSSFSFWHLADCTESELIAHIEGHWSRGMDWSNYGEWQMEAVDARPVVTLDDLYAKSRHTNYLPAWKICQTAPVVRKRVAK